MNYLLAYLPDSYLHQIAGYFAAQRPPFPAPSAPTVNAQSLALGKALVTGGDHARGIPACVSCHGATLTGVEPAIPGLLGLHADYISAQLGAARYGTRRSVSPDCMHDIATRLNERDITAVAAWLASLPAPANPSPAAAGTLTLPLKCGSVPAGVAAPQPVSHMAAEVASQVAPRATGDAALIARGEYLARAGDCIACHTVPAGKLFGGRRPMETPFGTLYSPNISSDKETGIGRWTADEFYTMLHEGKSRDGSLLYPAMPFASYTKVTRADSDAIYAYLQSVPPVHQPNRPHELKFPFNQRQLLLGWRTLFLRQGEYRPDLTQSVEWNRGAYLVEGLGHCTMCHTQINALGGNSTSKQFQGGLIPMQNWYAPSLTSNREAGLGDWSIDDIVGLLHAGVSKRGAVYGPMAEVVYDSFQYLSEDDVRAVAVYLKALPSHSGEAQQNPPGVAMTEEQNRLSPLGKKIYAAQCATCHAAQGQGKLPQFPPLAGNQSIQMTSSVNPIRMVLNGGYEPGTSENPMPYGMPPFAQTLSDEEVAAVVTYIRTAWGNHGTPVSVKEVNALRPAPIF
ncbi:c-type cytochrome [Paraburkholderia sp. 35.1]|uniref:c-type cytochrome n=1 Tax=unclassified Paraburkholderia TaxID=2615204 RepID=UPI003D1D5CC3